MKKKYIAHANMPPRFPIYLAAVGWLLLDRLGAPGWAHGVLWTVVAVMAIGALSEIIRGEAVDINKS